MLVEQLLHLILGLAKFLLETTVKLILFALHVSEVVVGELAVLLLQLAFQFVPVSFDLIGCSTHCYLGFGLVNLNVFPVARTVPHPPKRRKPLLTLKKLLELLQRTWLFTPRLRKDRATLATIAANAQPPEGRGL